MPKSATKSMQQRPWIVGALAAALWITPAAAQTAGAPATSDGSGEAAATEQATVTSGTGSSAEADRASQAATTPAPQTGAANGSTPVTQGASATSKDPTRSILDEDPGRWPYAGRSSSDRAQ